MTPAQAVIRDRGGTVHRIECLHRHARREDALTAECSVWEIKTGTETAFDIQILLTGEARKKWNHNNPDLPFCPGAELPEPMGTRRFSGAIGVVEAVLHGTDLDRSCRILVDSSGRVSLADGVETVALRDEGGEPVRIEFSLPEGSSPI